MVLKTKKIQIFLSILLLQINVSLSADVSPEGARVAGQETETLDQDTGNPLINRFLDDPIVKEKVEKCNELEEKDENNFENLGDCIWLSLPLDKREELSQKIEASEMKDKAAGNKYEALDLGNLKSVVSPEMEKAEAYYTGKVNKALYGENPDEIKLVDQGHFYQLYKTQIGKNLIQSMTAYCINTNFEMAKNNKRFLYERFEGSVSKENKETKQDKNTKEDAEEKTNQDKWQELLSEEKNAGESEADGKTLGAYDLWKDCIQHIQYVCIDANTEESLNREIDGVTVIESAGKIRSGLDEENEGEGNDVADTVSSGEGYCRRKLRSGEEHPKYVDECRTKFTTAQSQACIVYDQMKKSKQSLRIVDQVIENFEKIAAEGGGDTVLEARIFNDSTGEQGKAIDTSNFYKSEGENSINSITTVTSTEILDDAKLSGEFEAQNEKFKECMDLEQNNVEISDTDKCAEYLATNKKERDEEAAEFILRRRAMEERYAKDLEDEENVKKALEEQGYSDEKITELMEIEDGDFIKEQLQKRFAAQSDAIHRDLLDKIGRNVSSKDGEIGIDDADDIKNLKIIGNQLAKRTDRMRQLFRFNNIVSGYLQVSDGSGKTSSNLLSLEREVATIEDDDKVLGKVSDAIDNTNVRESGTVEDGPDGDNAVLGADEIESTLMNFLRKKDDEESR